MLRTVANSGLQLIIEADSERVFGTGRFERSGERTASRNGHRERAFDTHVEAAPTWPVSSPCMASCFQNGLVLTGPTTSFRLSARSA